MTNGEMIQEMFPNIEITEITDKLVKYVRVEIKDKDSKKVSSWIADIGINWWNAECDESTIGDCVSRAHLYNKIKGIDHDEDYECDEFGGSKITYHTCDWDEVLREIEDAPTVTPLSSGLDKSSKELEKNLGELDCISRESVLKLIYDYKENHSNDREHYPINYGTLLDMIRWVRELPPITSQL